MKWSEETISRLQELWNQGLSTAEIGRRLGVSKNAIVGKAHKLDLTARPSPIRRAREPKLAADALPRDPRTNQVMGSTLPPLPSKTPQDIAPAEPQQPAQPAVAVLAPPAAELPAASATNSAPPARGRRPRLACQWPIGEPGKKDFRFCDDPSIPGKPYCEEHAKFAYVRIRDRKEDAA